MPSLNRLYLTKFPFDADSSHQSIPQPYSSSSDTSHRPLRAHHYSMAGRKDQTSKPIEAQFSQILKDASSLYSEASGEKLNDYLNPPLKSIDALMRQLDKQNEQFTKFREKRKTLFGALAAALTPVEVIGGIVAGAAAEMFEPADSIFGAVCYLINAARDVSAAYDTIVELFEQLKDFTSRLDVYVQHQMGAALRAKVVTILATLFEVFVLATKEVRRGRVKSFFKRIIGRGSPVADSLEKLKALNIGEERQVLADTYGGVAQLNVKTDRVEDIVTQMNDTVLQLRTEARERSNEAHRDKLKEILEPSPFPEDFFNAIKKSRTERTGEWILKDESLHSWLKTETRFLWVSGAAGTGKSFLATRLIDWAATNLPHLAYFYFRDNNPETRSVLQALRDVAYQLSENDAFYAKQLLKRLHSTDEIRTIPSAIRKLFVEPFEEDMREKTLYIFFDGLDEAEPDEVNILLEQLGSDDVSVRRPEYCKIQVALVGRSYLTDAVVYALDPLSQGQIVKSLHVTPDRNAQDVKSFIEESIYRSRILGRTNQEFKKEVIDAMVKQVDGLFILAKFMLADINRMRHPRSILQSLKTYPKEINGMLTRTLQNLSQTMSLEEAADLNEMLQWIACAEEVLSLELLEAVMILKFGDSPFHLEETLRGQYACFFELEREDGLTTDELIKEHEKKQRLKNGDDSSRRSSSARRPSPNPTDSPRSSGFLGRMNGTPNSSRVLSPALNNGGKSSSPSISPGQQPSPTSSPDPFDPTNDIQYRSNKSTTWVTFFHTSVKEFFSKENSSNLISGTDSSTIGFDPAVARIHILKTCLRIFTDKAWFEKAELDDGRQAIKQYAAWYWQEHLEALDPATVPAAEKRDLGQRVYQMLTDDAVILDWSIMYEKNNEGLEVLTDRNMRGLRKWMGNPEILASMPPDAKTWASKAVTESPGIFKPIGDLYARAWLSESFGKYIPTLFCFKIVHAIASLQEGYSWSDSNTSWAELALEKRITRAAEWSQIPETAHWHRRFGSTYLTNGMHNMALKHYDRALALDNNSVETKGRIAYCLSKDGRFQEALVQALGCEAIELESIASGKLDATTLAGCKWRLYKDHILAAKCYSETNKTEEALVYYIKAIESAKNTTLNEQEHLEPEIARLEILASQSRHAETMDFLVELSSILPGSEYSGTRLTDFLLDQHNKPLVIDWIPRAASKVGQADFVINQLIFAIEVADATPDPLRALYLRLSLGASYTYSRDIVSAIDLLERITSSGYRPRGNVPTRQAYALAFQKLASLYREQALHAGLETPQAKAWIGELERVQSLQSKHQNQDMPLNMVGSDINVAAIYLALFYRLLDRKSDADALLRTMILDSLAILSDDDSQNDEYALDNLLRLFIAAADIENARGLSQSMRKIDTAALLATPVDSPILTYMEPKLSEIQNIQQSCAQCLEVIPPSEEYSICQYCMECYCGACMKVIQGRENKTSDRRADIICRSDHEWFSVPPLGKILHRGEILIGGEKVGFRDWKAGLEKRWR